MLFPRTPLHRCRQRISCRMLVLVCVHVCVCVGVCLFGHTQITHKLVDKLAQGIRIEGFQYVLLWSRGRDPCCCVVCGCVPPAPWALTTYFVCRYQPIHVNVTKKTGGSNYWMDMTLQEGKVRHPKKKKHKQTEWGATSRQVAVPARQRSVDIGTPKTQQQHNNTHTTTTQRV